MNWFLFVVLAILNAASVALGSDQAYSCSPSSNAGSANIALPADDASHYPNQWHGDRRKLNLHDPNNGFEYTLKTYRWLAFPVQGGQPIDLQAFVAGIAAYLPSPFSGGQRDWVRVVLGNLAGPSSDNYHYVYVAPGQFAAREGGYDYGIGGVGEGIVSEATDSGIVPVEGAGTPTVRLRGAAGSGFSTEVTTRDGTLRIQTREEARKPVHPLFNDGYDPLFRYFYQRSELTSTGTLTYRKQDYRVVGTANEIRQWQLSLEELPKYRWFWSGFNIEGCLNGQGRKVFCSESLRSFSLWDAVRVADRSPEVHYLNEMEPPPGCGTHTLSAQQDWSITPVEDWFSPRSGIRYARKVHVAAPALGIDLTLTAVHDDQEIYKAAFLFPGFWEGAVEVSGTIKGNRVWGNGYLEQWNRER